MRVTYNALFELFNYALVGGDLVLGLEGTKDPQFEGTGRKNVYLRFCIVD